MMAFASLLAKGSLLQHGGWLNSLLAAAVDDHRTEYAETSVSHFDETVLYPIRLRNIDGRPRRCFPHFGVGIRLF